MNYRILNEDNKQIKGSAFFHVGCFIVYFGISENKKVKVFNKTNEKELFFKNMDECFEYISQENKRQMELDT
jgi:hypothetical protein